MKAKTEYIFIILSNQPFDLELKTNKWHVANILAEKGYKVIFVDPPLRFQALKKFIKNPSFNLSKLFYKTEKKNKNLIVYSPANLFNFWPFSLFNTKMHSKKISSILKDNKINDAKVIMWVYHFDFPDLRNFLNKINYDMLIYDCVDEYTAFPEYAERKKTNKGLVSVIQWLDDELKIRINQRGLQGKEWVLAQEEWLSKKADRVFASAPGLVNKLKKWSKHVYYLPNAAKVEKFDFDRFTLPEPNDLKPIKHPRIGFTGAIDAYKNNIKLIEKVAETYPNYNFVLIGPERLSDPDLDLTKLKKMKNIYFLGKKPWQETPNYFNHFDAYFIPYNLNDYTIKGCFPVKYFEALAAGLPTVVTNLPAYADYDVDGYVSKTEEEFVKNIKRALEEDSKERIKKRKEIARQNSWQGKVNNQLAIINEFFSMTSAN